MIDKLIMKHKVDAMGEEDARCESCNEDDPVLASLLSKL